jgi:putative zinc finger protein
MSEATLPHARLQELVGAFADRELSGEQSAELEAHLPTCATCRRELALQQDLARALAREPAPGASPGLRRRIEWMGEPEAPSARAWRWAAAAAVLLIGVFAGTLTLVRRGETARPMAEIPVLRDALADCRRAMARNFPRKADLPALAEGLQFPIRTLLQPDAELFSTWKTTLAGSPAAGLAYRWRGIVVVQYTVSTEVIRQQPEVGRALSAGGFYTGLESGQGVIAVLEGGSGTVLIAEAPPEELRRLIL